MGVRLEVLKQIIEPPATGFADAWDRLEALYELATTAGSPHRGVLAPGGALSDAIHELSNRYRIALPKDLASLWTPLAVPVGAALFPAAATMPVSSDREATGSTHMVFVAPGAQDLSAPVADETFRNAVEEAKATIEHCTAHRLSDVTWNVMPPLADGLRFEDGSVGLAALAAFASYVLDVPVPGTIALTGAYSQRGGGDLSAVSRTYFRHKINGLSDLPQVVELVCCFEALTERDSPEGISLRRVATLDDVALGLFREAWSARVAKARRTRQPAGRGDHARLEIVRRHVAALLLDRPLGLPVALLERALRRPGFEPPGGLGGLTAYDVLTRGPDLPFEPIGRDSESAWRLAESHRTAWGQRVSDLVRAAEEAVAQVADEAAAEALADVAQHRPRALRAAKDLFGRLVDQQPRLRDSAELGPALIRIALATQEMPTPLAQLGDELLDSQGRTGDYLTLHALVFALYQLMTSIVAADGGRKRPASTSLGKLDEWLGTLGPRLPDRHTPGQLREAITRHMNAGLHGLRTWDDLVGPKVIGYSAESGLALASILEACEATFERFQLVATGDDGRTCVVHGVAPAGADFEATRYELAGPDGRRVRLPGLRAADVGNAGDVAFEVGATLSPPTADTRDYWSYTTARRRYGTVAATDEGPTDLSEVGFSIGRLPWPMALGAARLNRIRGLQPVPVLAALDSAHSAFIRLMGGAAFNLQAELDFPDRSRGRGVARALLCKPTNEIGRVNSVGLLAHIVQTARRCEGLVADGTDLLAPWRDERYVEAHARLLHLLRRVRHLPGGWTGRAGIVAECIPLLQQVFEPWSREDAPYRLVGRPHDDDEAEARELSGVHGVGATRLEGLELPPGVVGFASAAAPYVVFPTWRFVSATPFVWLPDARSLWILSDHKMKSKRSYDGDVATVSDEVVAEWRLVAKYRGLRSVADVGDYLWGLFQPGSHQGCRWDTLSSEHVAVVPQGLSKNH